MMSKITRELRMKKRFYLCSILFLVSPTMHPVVSIADDIASPVITPILAVDLNRYSGKWYEIASIPVWFQKDCDAGTTAEYSLANPGVLNVVNRCCTKEGYLKEAKGRAWIVDATYPAKLKVGFFSLFGYYPFKGDYWIIDLDPDYGYAVIGHPSRQRGWILSRTPQLPLEVLNNISERLYRNGYNFSDFKMTRQTGVSCAP